VKNEFLPHAAGSDEPVRAHIIVEGDVQGVFFRANTRNTAQSLAITGWVRNRPDGSVEIVAEGRADKVADFLRWCHRGPELARVDNVEVSWEESVGEFARFEIKR
jgi:acylphosphatase